MSRYRTGAANTVYGNGVFWEHVIRDEKDFARHVDYIHYNPVKEGWVARPLDWRWSSIHRYVRLRLLSADSANDSRIPLRSIQATLASSGVNDLPLGHPIRYLTYHPNGATMVTDALGRARTNTLINLASVGYPDATPADRNDDPTRVYITRIRAFRIT